MSVRRWALPLGALLVAGCGGGMPSKAPEPPEAPQPMQQQPGQQGYPQAPSEESTYAQPPPADALGPQDKGAERDDVEGLNLELDRAASELSAAGSDCTRACKALDSMSRTSQRICALEPDENGSSRCRRARERVAEAAERVRRSCTCP